MRADTLACVVTISEFVRDDYREFTDLSLVFLGAALGEIHYHCPGTLHKAKWMAKLIYSFKIALAEKSIEQLPPGTITLSNQMLKIRELATFITHVYCTWWLTCRKTVDAPWNDLQLFKHLLHYELVIKEILQSAVYRLSAGIIGTLQLKWFHWHCSAINCLLLE